MSKHILTIPNISGITASDTTEVTLSLLSLAKGPKGDSGLDDGDKGDITVSGSGAVWTIDNGAVTLAKQANMATASVVYRKTAGSGAPEVQTLATLKTDLGLSGTNSGDQVNITGNAATVTTNANLTGAVTSAGNATSLGSFTAAQLNSALSDADVATGGGTATGTNTGDNAANSLYSGLAASKQDSLISGTNIKTVNSVSLLGSGNISTAIADGDKGDITVSGTGTVFTIDAGAVTLAKQANMATASVVYRKTAGSGAPEIQTLATLKTDLGLTGTNTGDQVNITGNAATVTTNANLTGAVTSAGNATSLGSFTAAQLNAALSDADVATGGGTATGTNTGDNAANSLYSGLAASKQDSLISGTNIKTVNSVSLLGSGNISTAIADGDKGDITVSGTGTVFTIDAGAVTLAKQANMATASVVYRKTAGAGTPEIQTLATLKTDLGLSGTNSGDQVNITGNAATVTTNANLTGAVTSAGNATSLGSFTTAQLNAAISDADIATIDPIYTWATLPSAALFTGKYIRVSDVGTNGTRWYSDGSNWSVSSTITFDKFKVPVGRIQSSRVDDNGYVQLGTMVAGVTVSTSATSGTVTCTFSAAALGGTTALDVGRVITLDNGKQITITVATSTTVCTGTIGVSLSGTGPFSDWTLAWPISASNATTPLYLQYSYVYVPTSAIYAGSAAGFYYFLMTSTTTGIFYNNTYTLGSTPLYIDVPTAFSCTGPGEFNAGTAGISLYSQTIFGGLLGINANVSATLSFLAKSNSGSACITIVKYGGIVLAAMATPTGSGEFKGVYNFMNNGRTDRQRGHGFGTNAAPSYTASVDSTSDQQISISASPLEDNRFLFLSGLLIEILP